MKLILDKVRRGTRGYKYLLECPACGNQFWKNQIKLINGQSLYF